MNYAIDFYKGDDWSEPVDRTGYDYDLPWAICEISNWLLMHLDAGHSPDFLGATLTSFDRDEHDEPLVEETFTARNLGLVTLP